MDLDHEPGIEQQRQPVIPPEAPPQEPAIPQSLQDKFGGFYKDEVARLKVEQTLPGLKAWKEIEKAAERRETSSSIEVRRQIKPRSMMDKVHRQALLVQARIEGVRDLDRFQELADYFESTVCESERKHFKVPKGLTDEQKLKVAEEWKAEGWDGEAHYIYEHEGDRTAGVSLTRDVPIRLEGKHIKLMKGLLSSKNNPVELAKGLGKIGFLFSNYTLKSADKMRKLSEFFTAPHAKEALEQAKGISRWDSDWFSDDRRSYGKTNEVDQLGFLTQVAQSADPKTSFPPELVQKVNILSTALNMRVGAAEIGRLQTIMSNPDYLDFAAYLTRLLRSHSSYRIPVFENMRALDQAGLLKPVVDLYRSGVSLESVDRHSYSTDLAPSLGKLFDTYDAESNPQEVRQEVVQYLQGALAQPEVQKFMSDTQRREFVGLLGDLRGNPLAVRQLSQLNELFGEGLSRGKEAIFVLKSLQGKDGEAYNIGLKTLAAVASNRHMMETITNEEFPKFMKALESKTGYRPSNDDLLDDTSSKLADVFNNSTIRDGLVRDSTTEVIKALGTGINLIRPEYYIRLGNNPNMVPVINALKNIGCILSDLYSLPDPDMLEAFANDPTALSKLESSELKNLITQLNQEFEWKVGFHNTSDLLELYDNKKLQQQLFIPENAAYIRKVRKNGLSLNDVNPMLALDHTYRDLLVNLVDKFNFYPDFSSRGSEELQKNLDKLVQSKDLRDRLFSESTLKVFKGLQKHFYSTLRVRDIETFASAPSDFLDFVEELKQKYNYNLKSNDLKPLLQLAANKEGFSSILDTLINYGYSFHTDDIAAIARLLPHAERLPTLLSAVNQALSKKKVQPGEVNATQLYVFHSEDISSLLQLEPFVDRLPTTFANLREVMDYGFEIIDSQLLASIIEGGYTKDQLVGLKQIHDKYRGKDSGEFNFGAITNAILIEGNEDTITRLEGYKYKFKLEHASNLRRLLEHPDKDRIFQTLDTLRDNLPFSYNPDLYQQYIKIAQIPNIEEKIREAVTSVPNEDLLQESNFKLFVTLRADAGLYNKTRRLLSDDYFRNIRDAQHRLEQFNRRILSGEIPDDVLVKIFAVSGKATELDRIAHKYGIASEIAGAAQSVDWQGPLLQSANFQEANEALARIMTNLAIPVIYSSLEGEELRTKQNMLVKLAGEYKEFDDILEINCRAVGVYGQKYPKKGHDFDVLMGAIKQSLELNMERNPKAYLQKRADISQHQFDRVFEGVPQDVRSRVMKTWLDLAPRRRLRVSGKVVTAEEATLSRLNRIRDIVRTDLSVHLQELFTTKVRDLEAMGETDGPGAKQLAIYKQYLMSPEGAVRQDILMMYRSAETFIRDAQARLKNPETPKSESKELGKIIGTYQGVSGSLKALYRLGTINEERYKVKRDYLNGIEKHIGELSGFLKRLRLLDTDKRSADINTRALEDEVLLDFRKLKGIMAEENIAGQTVFETESTVAFKDLATAPDITQSCQRLTEVTSYNHAAYSRLLDGSNEMIDIFEIRNGERNRLARSFVELSRVRLTGEDQSKLAVLIDREYVNPQYQNFGSAFSSEMMLHMLDRLSATPELSVIFDSNIFTATSDVQDVLQARGYQSRQVSGAYFVNESNVKLAKYYDSLGGLNSVTQPFWKQFDKFCIIERI